MCVPCARTPSDTDIITFLSDHDFEGDIDATIARAVAEDFLKVYPRSGETTEYLLRTFKGNDLKIIPLTKQQRRMLADYIFPQPDSS